MIAENDHPPLEIVPLGGLGEFGLNMMAFGMGDTLVVVDAGVMFPGTELLGVDLVIPDMSYLFQNKDRLTAVLLTHGHEDHIGALPYLLKEVQVPVYGTRLTLGICRHRLEEHHLAERTELRPVAPGDICTIGPFNVDFIRVSHSLADAVALAIETPHGTVDSHRRLQIRSKPGRRRAHRSPSPGRLRDERMSSPFFRTAPIASGVDTPARNGT